MKCLKVKKQNANLIRKQLIKNNQLNNSYKIQNDEVYVYLPLYEEYNVDIIDDYLNNVDCSIIDFNFKKAIIKPKNFLEYLDCAIPQDKVDQITKSFDIIGSIVIVEIPENLLEYKYDIGNAVLKFTKRDSVYYKKSKVQGVMRTRQLEHIAGIDNLETTYKEFGLKFMLNPTTVYFSPRLATERSNIVKQVKNNEIIIDFFAGIGSFPVSIAHQKNATIYNVDINPEAIKYAKINIQLNKLKGEIIPILGDITSVIDDLPKADRIIMNLPGTSREFLTIAIDHIKSGGIINYYEFTSDPQITINYIKTISNRNFSVLSTRQVKSQSPGVWHYAFDIKII